MFGICSDQVLGIIDGRPARRKGGQEDDAPQIAVRRWLPGRDPVFARCRPHFLPCAATPGLSECFEKLCVAVRLGYVRARATGAVEVVLRGRVRGDLANPVIRISPVAQSDG